MHHRSHDQGWREDWGSSYRGMGSASREAAGLHPGRGGLQPGGGGLHRRGALADPLPPPELGKWAVRMLLECFLVFF